MKHDGVNKSAPHYTTVRTLLVNETDGTTSEQKRGAVHD